jgi:PAS domain S-box-containing protein
MVENQSLLTQNMQLARELKQRIDQLAAVGTVAASVSQSLDLDRTLTIALTAVLDTVGAEAGGISLIDESDGMVVLRAQQGWMQDFVQQKPMRIPLGEGMSGRVIATDSVVVNNNLSGDEQLAVPSFHDEHFRSIVMAPMHARSKIIGILSIMSSKPHHFDDEVIGMLRVISDTVGVALDNARLYETSVENESRLSAILQSTADGILATSQAGRIQLINPAAERLLNVKAADMIGVRVREAPIQYAVRNSLLVALSSRSEDSNKIFQVTLGDGRILSVLVSSVYVESQFEEEENTDGWVIVLQDVTHLRQAEEARIQFIHAAAHDMRNPLGITINSLELLGSMIQQDKDVNEVIEIAMQGATRIQGLIDDLLNLEHIESGYGFKLIDTSVGDLVDEVIAEITPCFEDKQLRHKVEVERGIPVLHIDRRWVVRAVLNYLDNAYKYIQREGHITLRVFKQTNMLHIEVEDNGPGMTPETQARLFERFYRGANEDSDIPGSGLGLAIVKSVAEAHGGDVYVRSKLGEGSTFGLTLMFANDDEA